MLFYQTITNPSSDLQSHRNLEIRYQSNANPVPIHQSMTNPSIQCQSLTNRPIIIFYQSIRPMPNSGPIPNDKKPDCHQMAAHWHRSCQSEVNRRTSRRVTGNKSTMETGRSVSTEDNSDNELLIRVHSSVNPRNQPSTFCQSNNPPFVDQYNANLIILDQSINHQKSNTNITPILGESDSRNG